QPGVLAIKLYKGGDSTLAGFEKPNKLASNETPFGSSEKAKAAFREAGETLWLYPEGSAAKLREAIGMRYGLDPARIVCGAGSDEIFGMLVNAYVAPGDEVVEHQYMFSVPRLFAQAAGAVVRTAPDHDYAASADALLAQMGPKTKLVFMPNPHNPSGRYMRFDEVRRLHAAMPPEAILVLDGAYAEFVQRNDFAAGIELVAESDNVVMTRTFSKAYGLAGLRLGWMYAPAAIVDACHRVRGPFNVSGPAIAAGVAAIQDSAFAERTIANNTRELARLHAALDAMGLAHTDSVANFTLVFFPDAPGKRAADADAFLRARGVIVRRMESYNLPHCLRMSIGSPEQNGALITALKEFMQA
ncbi:MAG: histidinol-phosphate transaminase, partial [Hyphomonadaceae bacterium]